MPVKIVTDSLSDLPPDVARELGVTVVPMVVRFGDKTYRDKVDLTMDEFYRMLAESPVLPTTSQPPVGAFEEVYRELAQETDQIYSLHVVSNLSGTYNSAVTAARNVPKARIRVVDSQQVSMALGWMVVLAARAAQEGKNLDRIDQLVNNAMRRVHIIAMLDTLEFAQRGGRLGKGAALAGTLLNVKPILSIVEGEVAPVEKVRTQSRALERLVDLALHSGPIEEIAVGHAAAPQLASQLRAMLGQTIPETQIPVFETGPVLGTHTGPGAVGLAWLNGRM